LTKIFFEKCIGNFSFWSLVLRIIIAKSNNSIEDDNETSWKFSNGDANLFPRCRNIRIQFSYKTNWHLFLYLFLSRSSCMRYAPSHLLVNQRVLFFSSEKKRCCKIEKCKSWTKTKALSSHIQKSNSLSFNFLWEDPPKRYSNEYLQSLNPFRIYLNRFRLWD